MDKKIEDYLHLYLGCACMVVNHFESILISVHTNGNCLVAHAKSSQTHWEPKYIKPLLRPLSDMTEDEFAVFKNIADNDFSRMTVIESVSKDGDFTRLAHQLNSSHYLLSKHFDLFGLIESSLAIDATTLKQTHG